MAKISVVCDSRVGRHAQLGDSTIEKFIRTDSAGGWQVIERMKPGNATFTASRSATALSGPDPWTGNHPEATARLAHNAKMLAAWARRNGESGKLGDLRIDWTLRCPLCGDQLVVTQEILWRLLDSAESAGFTRLSLDQARRALS